MFITNIQRNMQLLTNEHGLRLCGVQNMKFMNLRERDYPITMQYILYCMRCPCGAQFIMRHDVS